MLVSYECYEAANLASHQIVAVFYAQNVEHKNLMCREGIFLSQSSKEPTTEQMGVPISSLQVKSGTQSCFWIIYNYWN